MTVTLKNLYKSYGPVPVLAGVTAQLAGHTVLWGPSGCGKTTLARILWGLETPDAGEAVLSGGPAEPGAGPKAAAQSRKNGQAGAPGVFGASGGRPAARAGAPGVRRPFARRPGGLWLAAVFQDDRLCGQLTAVQNAALGCPAGTPQEKILAAFEALGMAGAALATPAALLSGGQRRRTALVRAALSGAPGAVLDEPFRGLDAAARADAMAYVRQAFAGRFLLIATHDEAEAAFFGPQRLTLPLLYAPAAGQAPPTA